MVTILDKSLLRHRNWGPEFGIWLGCWWQLAYSSRRTPFDLQRPPTNACRWDAQFDINPRDSTHNDESPCPWNTRMTVYSWVMIQNQAWRLRGEFAYLSSILEASPNVLGTKVYLQPRGFYFYYLHSTHPMGDLVPSMKHVLLMHTFILAVCTDSSVWANKKKACEVTCMKQKHSYCL